MPKCVVFSERAFTSILVETQEKIRTETGGVFLGYRKGDVWYVIESIDPGPNSVFQPAYFEYDQDYINHLINKVSRLYSLQLDLIGLWHRHPGSYDSFSGTDDGTNTKYAELNEQGAISTLLHTIIMSALTTYSPDELNLYLLDFKSGTEFQVYANHKIPHIKVLALDAMQEFGQSVLDELIGMMQKRLDMFTEETQKGYPVKDITSYRKYTGKKMPRILVVADEFQVLFSEAHNRRVANTCATRLADIISLYRVCGIHFILATQTMSRLRNGFTVSPSTLSEMHVRIGLKCSESECNLLFGGTNAKAAFDKIGYSLLRYMGKYPSVLL